MYSAPLISSLLQGNGTQGKLGVSPHCSRTLPRILSYEGGEGRLSKLRSSHGSVGIPGFPRPNACWHTGPPRQAGIERSVRFGGAVKASGTPQVLNLSRRSATALGRGKEDETDKHLAQKHGICGPVV